MKKSRVLTLTSISTILGFFMINFVSAAFNIKDTFVNTFSQLVGGNFNTFKDFIQQVLSPEILFGLLIFLIVFAIVDRISLFSKNWIKLTVSIVVAFLAGGFIDTSLLIPILNQYTALGITISFIFPFILIFYFLKEIAPSNALLQKAVWAIFGIFIIINAWVNWDKLEQPTITKTLYWIIIIGALVMTFFSAYISKKLFTAELKTRLDLALEKGKIRSALEIKELEDALGAGLVPKERRTEVIKMIEEARNELGR